MAAREFDLKRKKRTSQDFLFVSGTPQHRTTHFYRRLPTRPHRHSI